MKLTIIFACVVVLSIQFVSTYPNEHFGEHRIRRDANSTLDSGSQHQNQSYLQKLVNGYVQSIDQYARNLSEQLERNVTQYFIKMENEAQHNIDTEIYGEL